MPKRHVYHTEYEHLKNNQFQIYRLSQLASNDQKHFEQVCDYLPFSVHINKLNLDMVYVNSIGENWLDMNMDLLVKKGFSIIKNISDPFVIAQFIKMIEQFSAKKDPKAIFTHYQRLILKGKMSWLITHKALHDHCKNYFNVSYMPKDLGKPGKILEGALEEAFLKRNGWEIFCSLSKREKEILHLLSLGYTSKQISDELCISKLTADTHRRNIFEKTETKTYAELFKFAQVFHLI